jgi:ribosomal protein S18 acetylase RimI-like enzyme
MQIRRLNSNDAAAYQSVRLVGLREAPFAFSASYEEEKDSPIAILEGRLSFKADRGSFGAFEDDVLVGVVTLGREDRLKLAHKAFIWGMYVLPEARRKGTGRALLTAALGLARSLPETRQVNLSVTAGNVAAARLYESLGFRAFGQEPNALLVDGGLHDEIHMYFDVEALRRG